MQNHLALAADALMMPFSPTSDRQYIRLNLAFCRCCRYRHRGVQSQTFRIPRQFVPSLRYQLYWLELFAFAQAVCLACGAK